MGDPQNGWFIVEIPIKMNDLGVPLFMETSIACFARLEYWMLLALGSVDRADPLALLFGCDLQIEGSHSHGGLLRNHSCRDCIPTYGKYILS